MVGRDSPASMGEVEKKPLVPARVFDPFSGAGTTMLAANLLGRHAVGAELSSDYADMARQRIARELNPSTYRSDEADDATLFMGESA